MSNAWRTELVWSGVEKRERGARSHRRRPRRVKEEMFSHDGPSDELFRHLIRQHPFVEQKVFVATAPVKPIEPVRLSFLLVESGSWRANGERDSLNKRTKCQTYFLGKDVEVPGPGSKGGWKVHRSASSHLSSPLRESARASPKGISVGGLRRR